MTGWLVGFVFQVLGFMLGFWLGSKWNERQRRPLVTEQREFIEELKRLPAR